MTYGEKIKRVAKILKERYTNMTVDETLELAVKIVDALDEPK